MRIGNPELHRLGDAGASARAVACADAHRASEFCSFCLPWLRGARRHRDNSDRSLNKEHAKWNQKIDASFTKVQCSMRRKMRQMSSVFGTHERRPKLMTQLHSTVVVW